MTDKQILNFWEWCGTKEFSGIVLWNSYNEPTLALSRIRRLMQQMRQVDHGQPFQITTNSRPDVEGFDIVAFTDYAGGAQLDNRIATATGEGLPYADMPPIGRCGRGLAWEVLIDFWGNWNLCCNDWRCEEAVGNIQKDDWEEMYVRWKEKGRTIQWNNKTQYQALPRMCRACLDKNPSLSKRGGV
jgi:hypothetical protein